MENIYDDPNVTDEKICYKECIVPFDTVVNTSEKEKLEHLKETPTSKIGESANNKIGDNRKFERIYISGQKFYRMRLIRFNVYTVVESANRKEKIAEITPGWCE
ncbi:471_t:CDS:2 [Dentiscutata heterogama]|uniref:471_t:CDS:1 n=1 Tax=Dentiscutata heterogama TaxID=1316150 RepID=A0ACA9L872_9GLOM|nr:471_t:CDS:2 [Dentiscutata heterogama]